MKKRFLLADDDIDDKQLFCEALGAIDKAIECKCVDSGRDVVAHLKALPLGEFPDLIFLDINMPQMDGWQCLMQLKSDQELSHVPIMMYSTSNHERDVRRALELGALCLFTKPVSYKQLKTILETIATNVRGNLRAALNGFSEVHFE